MKHLKWLLLAIGLFAHLLQAQTVEYIHTDALGSPVAVTNASGAVIERTVYDPYGAVLNHPVTDGPGYTGHVADAISGLNYMQQRYYDPALGRFLSIDPVGADGSNGNNFNRYWYANNNPYAFVDLEGACTGSNIAKSDGTCVGTGGFTTDTAGVAQGAMNRAAAAASTVGGPTNGAQREPPMEEPLRGGFSNLLKQLDEWSRPPGIKCGENTNCLTFPVWGTPRGGLTAFRILEQEGNVIIGSFNGAAGEARVITELVRQGDTLILRGTHIEGAGTLKEALNVARQFGRDQGVKRVIIEGGRRSTGANPGHIPRPITIETGL